MKVKDLLDWYADQPKDNEVTIYLGNGTVLPITDIHDSELQCDLIDKFVTAKTINDKIRQGYVVSLTPFVIRGESGTYYTCKGQPTIVEDKL